MKFIHCADLHLASCLTSYSGSLSPEQRRRELRESFRRLADYAVRNEVTAILICGDIFDEKKPQYSEIRHFLDIASSYKTVDFLCLSGNHDESLSGVGSLPENIKCFDDENTKYTYGNIDIYGFEKNDPDLSSLDPDRLNIVMLHGQTADSRRDGVDEIIVLPDMRNKNIDYLALGHIHSYKRETLDSRGVYCYSGCLEGRGFDECGDKGFVLLECSDTSIKDSFVKFSKRTIREISIEVPVKVNTGDVIRLIEDRISSIPRDDGLRAYICGEISDDSDIDIFELTERFKDRFFALSVKDRTTLFIDPEMLIEEMSLRGEFVRSVLREEGIDESKKKMMIKVGLSALSGKGGRLL